MRHVCEHVSLSQLRFCAARFRLLNMKVCAVSSVREIPPPRLVRPIPLDDFDQTTHNIPLVVFTGLPLQCGGYKRHQMPTWRIDWQSAQEAENFDQKVSTT